MRDNHLWLIASGVVALSTLAACTDTTGTNNGPEEPSQTSTVAVVTEEPTTVPTTVPKTVTTQVQPDYTQAQGTLDEWASAISAGDVERALSTHEVESDELDSTRESMAYLAAVTPHAEFNECQFSVLGSSDRIQAQCELTLTDPILVATGMETVQVSWQLKNDGSAILVSEPGNRMNSKNIAVSYMKEHHSEEFEDACGPENVNYNFFVGWAFNRACGELTAGVASDIVEAIEAAG